MVLFMGFVAFWAAGIQESAFAARNKINFRFEKRTTLATIIYTGATRRMSYAGLTTGEPAGLVMRDEFNPFSGDQFVVTGDELRLDDRVYAGIGNVEFSIQDTGSLVET